ncbi:ATP-dependent helicase smarcad1, partial [Nowakowskiella sp. JEL0078]
MASNYKKVESEILVFDSDDDTPPDFSVDFLPIAVETPKRKSRDEAENTSSTNSSPFKPPKTKKPSYGVRKINSFSNTEKFVQKIASFALDEDSDTELFLQPFPTIKHKGNSSKRVKANYQSPTPPPSAEQKYSRSRSSSPDLVEASRMRKSIKNRNETPITVEVDQEQPRRLRRKYPEPNSPKLLHSKSLTSSRIIDLDSNLDSDSDSSENQNSKSTEVKPEPPLRRLRLKYAQSHSPEVRNKISPQISLDSESDKESTQNQTIISPEVEREPPRRRLRLKYARSNTPEVQLSISRPSHQIINLDSDNEYDETQGEKLDKFLDDILINNERGGIESAGSPYSVSSVQSEPQQTNVEFEDASLAFFNDSPESYLQSTLSLNKIQLKLILKTRPFKNYFQLTEVLEIDTKSGGRLWEKWEDAYTRFSAFDKIIDACKDIGISLEASESDIDKKQPNLINSTFTLKSYQLHGIYWIYRLYKLDLGGILADEMGLGKTAQVISFLSLLLESKTHQNMFKNVHQKLALIIVPSSTIDNWVNEINQWCPSLNLLCYVGSSAERIVMQDRILSEETMPKNTKSTVHILITSYNIAVGDYKFLRKLKFETMIIDEGHMLKNMDSARYNNLMKFKNIPFRLLLTGTPVQNNLMELIALLKFVMPNLFSNIDNSTAKLFANSTKSSERTTKKIVDESEDEIEQDGEGDGLNDNDVDVLNERVSRAKKMMKPFILRRKKCDVLQDLPSKIEKIHKCSPTITQQKLLAHVLATSRTSSVFRSLTDKIVKKNGIGNSVGDVKKKKKKKRDENENELKDLVEISENKSTYSNILMQLRKAANHPLLFREIYTDDI